MLCHVLVSHVFSLGVSLFREYLFKRLFGRNDVRRADGRANALLGGRGLSVAGFGSPRVGSGASGGHVRVASAQFGSVGSAYSRVSSLSLNTSHRLSIVDSLDSDFLLFCPKINRFLESHISTAQPEPSEARALRFVTLFTRTFGPKTNFSSALLSALQTLLLRALDSASLCDALDCCHALLTAYPRADWSTVGRECARVTTECYLKGNLFRYSISISMFDSLTSLLANTCAENSCETCGT